MLGVGEIIILRFTSKDLLFLSVVTDSSSVQFLNVSQSLALKIS